MSECPFCDNIDDKLIIHEDELSFSIISLNPINSYHALIIPKYHYESFIDLPDNLAAHVFITAKTISKAIRKICSPIAMSHLSDDDLGTSGINLVSHYKFHVFPRFENDRVTIEWARDVDPGIGARIEMASNVREHMR